MDSYRIDAHKKYQEKINREQEQIKIEQEQKNREIEEEQKYREIEDQKYREMEEMRLQKEKKNKDILFKWDSILLSLENDPSLHTEPLYSIYLCYSLINEFIVEIKESELLLEWKNRVVNLIHIINQIQEKRTMNQKINTEEVKQIEIIMKHLIEMTNLEVDIEPMDTSLDEKMALELTQNEWNQDLLNQDLLNQDLLNPYIEEVELIHVPNQNIPIVSLRRGVGLTLQELKQLAYQHGLKKSGTKEELMNRLYVIGLVRIIP